MSPLIDQSVRSFDGHTPIIGARVFIDPAAVVIGRVTLGDDVSVWPMAVIRADVNHISIGARSSIQDGAICHVTHDGPYTPGGHALMIGEECTIGHQVMLHGCRIGNGVLIGMGAIVLDGAVIEDEAMIGAGALVPPGKVIPSRTLWVGNPLKQLRDLDDKGVEGLHYSAQHYVRLKNRYLGA
jgi:carbonic anhydrase/acetyltransferase-like protein (isoleucine patch superfamily)